MSPARHTKFPYDTADLGLSDADRDAAHADVYRDFVAIVHRLRRECPWDREQTHDSVKHLTIEEAYELVDAIDAGDPAEMQRELGDLFLHVLFHAHIGLTEGTFDVGDVRRAEMTKLVRRHPHVFGDEVVGGTGDVLRNWEAVKRAERAETQGEAAPSALDGVPDALPALLQAERVQQKAAGIGFDFPSAGDAWAKVEEESAEVLAAQTADALEDEVGDLLFAVVNYARLRGVVPETALRRTTAKFGRRFRAVEAGLAGAVPGGVAARADGLDTDRQATTASLDDMEALWQAAKADE